MKFSILLTLPVLLLFSVKSTQQEDTDSCPSCVMPCKPNTDTASDSFYKRLFSHGEEFQVIALLNAVTGEAFLFSFHLDKIFSKTVYVGNYKMLQVCQSFSSTPSVNFIPKELKITVQFENFPSQELIPRMESKYFDLPQLIPYLTYRQSNLMKEFELLKDVSENLKKSQTDLNFKLINIENKQLEFTKKQKLENATIANKQKLEYAIMNATRIYGNTFRCIPSNYRYRLPCSARGADHCLIDSPNWLYIDLAEELTINMIIIYHYDGDPRVQTYSVQVSDDGDTWTDVTYLDTAQKVKAINFPQTSVNHIRMRGFNNYNSQFAMYWIKIDWV